MYHRISSGLADYTGCRDQAAVDWPRIDSRDLLTERKKCNATCATTSKSIQKLRYHGEADLEQDEAQSVVRAEVRDKD